MRRLRVRFDKELTKAIVDLSLRHGLSRSQVVHAAISMYKGISDLDLTAREDNSTPFSERMQRMAQAARDPSTTKATTVTVGGMPIMPSPQP
jgi:hypothetical protein